ncbi:MAG TPA: hypothetical protein VF844_12570 [Ktedonobacteraceae bacterium]
MLERRQFAQDSGIARAPDDGTSPGSALAIDLSRTRPSTCQEHRVLTAEAVSGSRRAIREMQQREQIERRISTRCM